MRRPPISPGWYAVNNSSRKFQNNLADAGFHIAYSFGYCYVQVNESNRKHFTSISSHNQVFRIKDIEVDRLINLALAHAAVSRWPGTKVVGKFTADDILRLLDGQHSLCLGCKVNIRLCFTIDHIVPRSRQGSNRPDNIQLLCKSCNSSKGDRTMDEWMASKFAHEEAALRQGSSFLDSEEEPFLEMALWIKRHSEQGGMKPSQQILDIVTAKKWVPPRREYEFVKNEETGESEARWIDNGELVEPFKWWE